MEIGKAMEEIQETSETRAEQNDQKFRTTKQETLRLQAALTGFFEEDEYVTAKQKEAYAAYLKKRIRPALQALLKENGIDEIKMLNEMGWFGAEILEELIVRAQEEGRLSAVIRLMRIKAAKYGYRDRDFEI
ncbi:MAG: hypothetical protein PUE72_04495 [Lachnospiraceae bacterium]|nr:hypothetical protein [Lachnospiraceae bacterium]